MNIHRWPAEIGTVGGRGCLQWSTWVGPFAWRRRVVEVLVWRTPHDVLAHRCAAYHTRRRHAAMNFINGRGAIKPQMYPLYFRPPLCLWETKTR